MTKYLRSRPMWLTGFAVIAVAVFYAPGFGGFWHGDDLSNLHRVYMLSQQGTLWTDTFRLFAEPVPSGGAFYRPMMMLSLALNYAFADAHYGGWYLVNLVVHLSNTMLVSLIVRRLATRYGCDAMFAAPLAALLFGLCPSIAEGVYWVSARSDGWVTLLSLAGVYCWVGAAASTSSRSAFALPLLLILALGFKESAAVLPLQMTLLAVAWRGPVTRAQRWAMIAAFLGGILFLVWRAFLFGNAWQVYAPGNHESVALHFKLVSALLSFGPWWAALTSATPFLAIVYVGCCAVGAVGVVLLAFRRPSPQWHLALALTAASGGLALATLLNLGAMSSTGEGGRLSYGPVAWLTLAIGVLLSRPHTLPNTSSREPFATSAAAIAFTLAVVAGSGVLCGHLHAASAAQASMRTLTQSIPRWAASHPGLTMLLVPDHEGAIVMARNAQGSMVLAPIQQEPYLHRVLPTLSSEIHLRQEQFSRGLVRRLAFIRPRLADTATLAAIQEPAEAGWPQHLACWSKSQQKIVSIQSPPTDATSEHWLASIRGTIDNCER